ncbi:YceI family protein [Echinicola strongylocentroti]|uniref:YceI family protein n=1 Tax=Echinicola strongylocentroti TaxID=1795355 RepID=A0A2Z4INR0_9BACT|nr:YceI family protein [Echinicola strongylocentroti]AWW32390.1 YceI family protein [Echinicola strongylocentroti]
MRVFLIVMLVWTVGLSAEGQSYRTEKCAVRFFSSAPLEDIKADNKEAIGVFNADSGDFAFVVQIKGFQFAKSLMQEHFNENFMESDKYPRGTFEGKIDGYDLSASGEQQVMASGKMKIHGVEQQMDVDGKLIVRGGKVFMDAVFPVKLEDHDIDIPKILFQKIAEEVEVTVHFEFKED